MYKIYEMTRLPLARKFRPQSLEDLIGQEVVSTTLKNALKLNQTAHAYLFYGPRGVGKTTAARILAKCLNCQKGPAPEACQKCVSCQEIARSGSIDVMEMDAATHTGIDNVREVIVETVGLAPSRDRRKIFIIDEAHMLSNQAFNALLKTLEEPPSHVVFILATTEIQKIPATIYSRCQRFRFRPIPVPLIVSHLAGVAKQEKIEADKEALELLAEAAGGSLRDALSLLDQASSLGTGKIRRSLAEELLGWLPEDLILDLAKALLSREPKAVWKVLSDARREGYEGFMVMRGLRDHLQRVYLHSLGLVEELDGSWKALASGFSEPGLSYVLKRLNHALEKMRFSDRPDLWMELELFSLLETPHDMEDWLRRLEDMEARLASSGLGTGDSGLVPGKPRSVNPAPNQGASAPLPAKQLGSKEPSPATPVAASLEAAWSKLLSWAVKEQPMLSSVLESARLGGCQEAPKPEIEVYFGTSFHLESAKRHFPLLEQKVSEFFGAPVRVQLKPAAGGSPQEPSSSQEKEEAPSSEKDPELSKVMEVFGGTVKKSPKTGR